MPDPHHPHADGFAGGFPPSEWLEKAESERELAELIGRLSDDRHHDALAFHCHQSVEKLMKAALVSAGVAPTRADDLPELLLALKAARIDWSWSGADLRKLTVGAAYARTPGYVISPHDAKDILRITRAVWNSLRPLI